MATYPHTINVTAGVSAHQVLVGLGLEPADHSTGQLCHLATMTQDAVILDGATVFEAGQAAGELSATRQTLLVSGLWRGGPDVVALRQYIQLANGTATPAQTEATLKALIRVVRIIATS